MTTPIVPTVTDELIAQLAALSNADPQGAFPIRSVVILALLAERADLKQQLAAASVDAERFRLFAETVVAECSSHEMTAQQAALFGCMNSVTSVSMDGLIEMFDAALATAAD